MRAKNSEAIKLTRGLVHGPLDGLDALGDGLDGDGVVPARLEIREGEEGVRHENVRTVPVEGLQIMVGNLKLDQSLDF